MTQNSNLDKAHSANKTTWNIWAKLHEDSDFYNVEGFISNSFSLKIPELDLVGNIKNKKLLHLQCHMGQDTLSFSKMGATVTGVDYSEVAIEKAKQLSELTSLPANFYCENVLNLPPFLHSYDLAVTTYGVLSWIDNLNTWAENIYKVLKKGGRLILVEFHPILEIIYKGKMIGTNEYFNNLKPSYKVSKGSYAVESSKYTVEEYLWQHTIADIVTALISVGFVIKSLKEYPYSSYGLFDDLIEHDDGLWHSPSGDEKIPYMFSIVAEK
jgi:2-polyprenyl-3-methyl-5-hydroxy-6-metoxy-1,4-benzoquinol methylase